MNPPSPRAPIPKLGFFPKFWFGFGQMAEGMKNSAFGFFLLLFYSQVLGMPAYLAGLVLAIALAIDALTDPLTGSISDALQHRFGRRHPFMYAAAVPMAITFAMAFHPPTGASQTVLFCWMLTFTVLARLSMTLYHVPHMSLGAELSTDYHERTVVVAFRNFFGLGGAAFLLGACALYFMRPSEEFARGQLDPAAYGPMGLFFGVLMGVAIFASALGTHSRIPYLPQAARVERFSVKRIFRELREALENRSFRMLFIGLLIFYVARGTADSLGIYMNTFFWKLESQHAILIGAAALFGMVLATPVWAVVARPFDKRSVFMFGIVWYSSLTAALPILKLVGLFPSNESALYVPLIYAFSFIGAAGATGSLLAAGSMMADIADEHELSIGRRQEGIFFGALAFSGKAAVGIGAAIGGAALTLIHFPVQVEVVPWDIVFNLGLIAGPGVAVLMAAGIAVMSRYDLSRQRLSDVQAQLAARRVYAEAAEPASTRVAVAGGGS